MSGLREAGQVIDDRYRLLGRIGSGGMADVWCAEDDQLGRRVALKFLHERFAQDDQFVERFRREAAAAAGLQHPNVVGVYDRGQANGTHYIAMEYVEGASLKDLINRGLSVPEAVEIIRQVLAGTRFAHARGIVHRDLKPQNVLVDAEGRARVTDFGIARAGASEITQTGSILGTAHYLSPEQAQGLPVTAASDVYSVGVMLYEALTGRVPFEGDSAVSVALKQVSEQPRAPSELNPNVPRSLDAVVLKALAKDPANRFASADEFLRALDAAEADPSGPGPGDTASYAAVAAIPPPPPRDPFFTRNRVIVLALLLLALAGIAAFALTRPNSELVPSVIGDTVPQARSVLEKAGFDVATRAVADERTEGTVLKQDPRAGSHADEGSTVTITYSAGLGTAPIPGVAGLPQDRAKKTLQNKGFIVKIEEQHSFSVETGVAIGTRPAEGTELERGRRVILIVSTGPQIVEVPGVVGKQQDIAESELRAAGLVPTVEQRNSDEPEGQVIAQSPDAGTSVRKRSTVTIVVSTGAGSVVVRDVIGQSEDTAKSVLRSQGLTVSVLRQATNDPREDGRVLDQAPNAGDRVHRGDEVTIVVGSFEQPPPPPDGGTTTTPKRERHTARR